MTVKILLLSKVYKGIIPYYIKKVIEEFPFPELHVTLIHYPL